MRSKNDIANSTKNKEKQVKISSLVVVVFPISMLLSVFSPKSSHHTCRLPLETLREKATTYCQLTKDIQDKFKSDIEKVRLMSCAEYSRQTERLAFINELKANTDCSSGHKAT